MTVSPKVSMISYVSQYIVSHQRLLTIMNKSYVYSGSNDISQNKQICVQQNEKN